MPCEETIKIYKIFLVVAPCHRPSGLRTPTHASRTC
jgi:hypothetical protein